MIEKNLTSWEEYEREVRNLMALRDRKCSDVQTYVSPMLFRGQSDSAWRLNTTLERYSPKSLKVVDYYHIIHSAKYQIESLTEQNWNIPTPPDYNKWIEKEVSFGNFDLPGYDYMVYLRHHGFPSPLLDWSQSPYIAAFFAFCNGSSRAQYVSVYVFIEYFGQGKAGSKGQPRICGRGPYVRSHRRHVLQQCEYTICTNYIENQWFYACHEDVLSKNDDGQDMIWKLNIPSIERTNVLKLLDQYNGNAYLLFGSEESLMDTLAFREFTSHFGAL